MDRRHLPPLDGLEFGLVNHDSSVSVTGATVNVSVRRDPEDPQSGSAWHRYNLMPDELGGATLTYRGEV